MKRDNGSKLPETLVPLCGLDTLVNNLHRFPAGVDLVLSVSGLCAQHCVFGTLGPATARSSVL